MSECIHGLEEDWCATCKHGAEVPTSPADVATFRAKYEGDCRECRLPIAVGEVICLRSDDSYVHEGCRT